ncbi:hypothetical protein A2U01_0034137 [Trifolium medium]|uniref:Uncharacterized protein n=1 Tax=Trifolium medium TaxID=97028 RepID=A0A392PQ30_9FABA|nr:hypothetical protein [Trifolium medium]
MDVISDLITCPLGPLHQRDFFLGGNLTFAYDFFKRNDIGPYKSLLERGGKGIVWNMPNHLWEPDESTAADGNIVMEPFELRKFDESTLKHVKIVVYRVADDKIVATGD